MNATQEKVIVTIDEEKDKPFVHEEELTITLMDTRAEEEFPFINGILESFFIHSSNPINITIFMEKHEHIPLLFLRNFSGQRYFPLRVEAAAPDGSKLNFGVTQFALNDKIKVIVEGVAGTKVDIYLRYC